MGQFLKQLLIYILIATSALRPEALQMNMDERDAVVRAWQDVSEKPDGMAKNNAYLWEDTRMVDYNLLDYSERKVVFIGDSLTFGRGNLDDSEDGGDGVTYCDMLAEILGITDYVNVSVCGNAISTATTPNITELYEEIPGDADLFIFMLGYNDYYYEATHENNIWEFSENCDATFAYIQEVYQNVDVFVVTEPKNLSEEWYHDDPGSEEDVYYEDFVKSIIHKAEKYGFTVFDLYHEGFMNNHDVATERALYHDTVHPNKKGYEYLAYHIAAHLSNYYSLERILGIKKDSDNGILASE